MAMLGSQYFFYGIAGSLVLMSLWLVFTGRYPMAFDENYHYEIIQQYAVQWSPFFSSPPPGTENLGDITRYPAYLYHYLMSFPYRLIDLFTNNDVVRIIFLRLLNVAMLTSSLVVFRKLFHEMRLSGAMSNLILAVFVFTPIVPFLGAHINYDNAVIPLTALLLLFAWRVYTGLKLKKLDIISLVWLGVSGLFTGLMKYTSLPIFVLVVLWLIAAGGWVMVRQKLSPFGLIRRACQQANKLLLIALSILLLVGVGLSLERYGINVVRYGHPVPDCAQILPESSCLQYGPWGRDYRLKQNKFGPPSWQPVRYTRHWIGQTMHETFFTISPDYKERSPLPVTYHLAWGFGLSSCLLIVLNLRRLLRNPALVLSLVVIVGYGVILWLDNYGKFISVNWPVAIHGRYWLPILPLMYLLIAYGFKLTIDRFPPRARAGSRVLLLAILSVALLQGGGILPYIVRSQPSWYWQNQIVISVNRNTQKLLKPLINE